MGMTKVHLSSQRSTPARKFSALRIEKMVLENLCSNMPLLEVGSCLLLLHLTCVFLVFLVKCCNGSSLKPARPMCDGRPLASPLFSPLGGSRRPFPRFPVSMGATPCLSLTRNITVHVATPYSRKDPLSECSRPYDNLSCPCFTALWLQQSQSTLVQENQPAKDIDLTCFKTFPIKATTCLPVGPMSLDWPVDPCARFDQSRPSPLS